MDWAWRSRSFDTVAVAAIGLRDEERLAACVRDARGIFDSDFLSASDLEECAQFRAQLPAWGEHEQSLVALRLARPDLEP
jgi:hypothetical protein